MTVQATTKPQPSLFRRLILLLLIVIVLLGLSNLAILGIRTLDRPARPAAGELLYATTFDAYNEEWSREIGQMSAQVTDGNLVVSIDARNDGTYSVLNHDFTDFDARIDAKRITANDEYNELGLLFRYRDRDNYYMFKIRGDGFYRVERRKDKQVEVLSEWHASPAILIGLNTVNQLRVVGKGDHFQFYINDQPLTLCPSGPGKQKSTWNGDQCLSNNKQTSPELVDNTFDYGRIGAGVRVDVPGIQVVFDNVLVYGPQ
ncbi:MAG: hypothetical protein IT324_07030 [Anaerolineae bacterium]|nr:hypothetical protein [Anaerolineae bacterium]